MVDPMCLSRNMWQTSWLSTSKPTQVQWKEVTRDPQDVISFQKPSPPYWFPQLPKIVSTTWYLGQSTEPGAFERQWVQGPLGIQAMFGSF